jgi:hypothetical protein
MSSPPEKAAQYGREIVRSITRHRYDFASASLIVVFFLLLFALRPRLPVVSDSWYHLGVIRAFYGGGLQFHDWWEFAPVGRPHLYSPAFHLVGAFVLRVFHWNIVELAQWFCVWTFPLLLAAGWGAARMIFGACAAFLTLLLLASNIGLLFPCSIVLMPGTYALMLWPYLLVFAMRGRWLAAGLVLMLMGYVHFGVAGLAVVSLLLVAIFQREFFREILLTIFLGVAGVSPWLLHIFRHREFLQGGSVPLAYFAPVIVLAAGVCGIDGVIKQRNKMGIALLLMLAANLTLWFTIQDRFWLHVGFVCALIGGYGIEHFFARRLRWVLPLLLAGSLTVTPFLKPRSLKLGIPVPCEDVRGLMGTPMLALANSLLRGAPFPDSIPQDIGELAHWIHQNTDREAILITDIRHLGTYLFALTGRRTTSGGWDEVMTDELQQQVAAYRQSGDGYLIVPVELAAQVQSPPKTKWLATIGRFAVFRQNAGATMSLTASAFPCRRGAVVRPETG